MPDVVLEGPIDIEVFFREFKPCIHRGAEIIRFMEPLFNGSKTRILFETVVVESGLSRRFYIEIDSKEGRVTVRLDPLTDPEKTDGVKRALALLAKALLARFDGAGVSQTNLQPFLDSPETLGG